MTPSHKKTTSAKTHTRTITAPARRPTKARSHAKKSSSPSAEKQSIRPGKAKLRIIPVGGCEEVGRNMTVLEYGNDIIIIDMGLQFPEENMPGIDYIIPNISYLLPKKKNIRGVIITHSHYDHIGGIPHIMKELGGGIPMYGTDITLAIFMKRQTDYKDTSVELNTHEITSDSKIKLGVFECSFFGVSHNIPGSIGVVIKTPEGIVVHTGDFKIDVKSDIAGKTEIDKIKALGKQNVLALMSDSTNAREPGHQFSEKEIKVELEQIIAGAKGRLIIGTFASLLGRLQQIIQLAEGHKKKVVVEGRSMKTNVEIARQLGYMKFKSDTIIPVQDIKNYPPHKVIILATGAQGESNAVLMRIVNKEHRFLRIQPADTVVFSSSVIPGNERSVQYLTDKLYRDGADVINYKMLDIHAGGHAKQEDLKLMINLVKPKYLIPIEGNHSFLKIHGRIAIEAGFDPKRIFYPDNGQVIEISGGVAESTGEKIPASYVFVDGLGVGNVEEVVLRDRQMLAEDGMFVIIAVVDAETGKVKGSPDIISRGFVYLRESKELLYETRTRIRRTIEEGTQKMHPLNLAYVKDKVRENIGQFLFTKTQKRPMVLPVIIEV
ncbi:MAG: ribonuclease J [Candidatus Ryanbacteria bacterium CG10_big_fil_rev_8_21_14_0_10_43_42]|uniref:Ribonuclease J n=1 Tax=Candidatus Ryanbacteria bacterium CG10_big_fil_rev_8_21_14_0_10_43_42 TaxID=1974864 RepID=A0A2M8KWT3_9BACT|nr:MAG: ribonuclease J [Candidatus Ryanbacteria bacterium CG10_big_fil_rev_8_21_14_0_10_43_42]